VTLEKWYLFGERVLALLQEAVEMKMREAGVELGWLDRAPYTVLSTDERDRIAKEWKARKLAASSA
jgi:hypothetical protein